MEQVIWGYSTIKKISSERLFWMTNVGCQRSGFNSKNAGRSLENAESTFWNFYIEYLFKWLDVELNF